VGNTVIYFVEFRHIPLIYMLYGDVQGLLHLLTN